MILLFFVSDHLSVEPKAVGSALLNAKYCRKIKGKELLNGKKNEIKLRFLNALILFYRIYQKLSRVPFQLKRHNIENDFSLMSKSKHTTTFS